MTHGRSKAIDQAFVRRALEITIRIGVVVGLAAWCFVIVKPFILPIAWGIIIAVATFPAYQKLVATIGGRRKLAAAIFVIVALVFLIGPTVMLSETLINGAKTVATDLREGTVNIPPPPARVAGLPLIGAGLNDFWTLASQNLEAALEEISPQLAVISKWLLGMAAGAGVSVLIFVASIIIAGVLLVNARGGGDVTRDLAVRLVGERGSDLAELAEDTVRGVTRGILGVAIIQALLAGLGFMAVGVPLAGFWAFLCLILATIQIGVALVMIPIVIYVFSVASPTTAFFFLVWAIFVTILDNVLKPILLGRGSRAPTLIIFIGAIGGFLAQGIIGLFIGSVVLVLGYELFMAWLRDTPPIEPEDSQEPTVI
ncbi:MAG: AI-2E family transporter [Gammaproteobacteria bacterium]|jgi:predicted PurR-regulated permease PerM